MDSIPLKSFIQFHGRLLASNPCTDLQFSLRRPRSIGRCVRLIDNKESSLPPPFTVEKRTLATVTGKLLSGLTSALLRIRSSSDEWTVVLPEEEVVCYPDSGKRSVLVAENPVILDQRSEESEQERDSKKVTSPGFSFSAAGLLFPYHLGVARFLLEKGYIKETTPLAGSSAGAVVCAVIASGSSMTDALQATKVLADDCRIKGTAFRLGAVLGNVLREFLPEDVHTRSNGRVRVAITQLSWRPKGLLVDRFDSKEDLINAVLTSSFIPGYSAPRFATLYRNRLCIDGGCTSFMPPTSAAKTVRICAFPAKRFRHIGISPHCSPEGRSSLRQLLDWALEPAEDEVLDKLYELGYLDAQAWAQNNRADSILTNEDFS